MHILRDSQDFFLLKTPYPMFSMFEPKIGFLYIQNITKNAERWITT